MLKSPHLSQAKISFATTCDHSLWASKQSDTWESGTRFTIARIRGSRTTPGPAPRSSTPASTPRATSRLKTQVRRRGAVQDLDSKERSSVHPAAPQASATSLFSISLSRASQTIKLFTRTTTTIRSFTAAMTTSSTCTSCLASLTYKRT